MSNANRHLKVLGT